MSSEPTIPIREDGQEWKALGERLRTAREYLGLSQHEVSELLGVSRPAVTQMEAGRRKVSTLELREFARLYRRPYEWLVGEEDTQPADEVTQALYRTTRDLSAEDRAQLLNFAQFLSAAGGPPPAPDESDT